MFYVKLHFFMYFKGNQLRNNLLSQYLVGRKIEPRPINNLSLQNVVSGSGIVILLYISNILTTFQN